VVCILKDVFTTVERMLISAGRPDGVREMRNTFQEAMGGRFKSAVAELTGRRVRALLSQVDMRADMAVEVFVLEPLIGAADRAASSDGFLPAT
jgi:uncharacterized protein YbcI